MTDILATSQMAKMLTLVEEAARSTKEGVKHFIEPAPRTLRRATSKRHHIVFGRRGSGKSSLLRKAAADLTIDRRPIAYVNLEPFKGHSYPDVILSVLIKTLEEFRKWMSSAAIHPSTKTSFWRTLFGTTPTRGSFNRKDAANLAEKLGKEIGELHYELHRTDAAELTVRSGAEATDKNSASARVKVGVTGASTGVEAQTEVGQKQTQEVEEKYTRSKTDFLHRHILDYQNLFHDLGSLSCGDAYLFLDDLYH